MDQHLDVLGQLAELRRWHEENCNGGGAESNNNSSILNSAEQARIYQLLGLSPSFISEIETSRSIGSPNRLSDQAINNNCNDSPKDETGKPPLDPVKNIQINNDLSTEAPQELNSKASVKRPFLKRGEGLTTRFKVDPDRFKLQNLPKYKFANYRKQRMSIEGTDAQDKDPSPPKETSSSYQSGSRKSCLKVDAISSQIALNNVVVEIKELGISASDYESEQDENAIDENATVEKVKRMLEFSKKSPKVTFDSEVIKIPFENYFQRHEEIIQRRLHDSNDNSSSDDEDIHIAENIINCTDNMTSGFKENGFSSTPVEVLKIKQLENSVDRSPRTVLVEKGSLLREKLKELEEETVKFREQNKQLIQIKQSLQLEKIELQNSRQDMERSLKEQKMKMELFFEQEHDKLEQERAKMEIQLKQPSKKIKEEIKGLQERIDELEKDLKARELKHGASQTRLRCHIRTLEKENKENGITIDSLKKENKKLEMENSRLLRQKNNKTLMEINKNIAKLASTNTEGQQTGDDSKAPNKLGSKKLSSTAQTTKLKPKEGQKTMTKSNKDNEPAWAESSSSDSSEDNSDEESTTTEHQKSKYFPSNEARVAKLEKINDVVTINQSMEHKKENVNEDGSKDVLYPNGNIKKVSADGMIIKMLYFNKDIKETNVNEGTVKYYYAETKTWHISYLDGLEILEFPSGQTEHRFKNGKVEIYFPNGLVRVTNPRDQEVLEEWRYPDGTVVVETRKKEKIINLPNGQKEIHTAEHKRREYPDGTVKIVHSDGRTETCYSNGRIRIKDKDGKLISDTQDRI